MKKSISVAALFAASLVFAGPTLAQGMKIGQDATALNQNRISNAGGGAGPNPHWGANPSSPSTNVYPGRNNGEAFNPKNGEYIGYAYWGEQGAYDVDPGKSGAQEHGGNAMN